MFRFTARTGIISGYDGDGADALRGIKDIGGITIAQKLNSASELDIPKGAIDIGWIDYILSPENLAEQIRKIA